MCLIDYVVSENTIFLVLLTHAAFTRSLVFQKAFIYLLVASGTSHVHSLLSRLNNSIDKYSFWNWK